MRTCFMLAAIFLSSVCRADDSTGVSEKTPVAHWSIGAGYGFFEYTGGIAAGVVGAAPPYAPTPVLAVERILSDRLSLLLGFTGAYSSGPVLYSSPPTTLHTGTLTASLGPRFVLTDTSFPVGVSIYAAGSVGYASTRYEVPEDMAQGGHTWSFGVIGGVAVERQLIEHLSLRIQAQLVRATLDRSFTRLPVTPLSSTSQDRADTSFRVSGMPSPSLELRLSF